MARIAVIGEALLDVDIEGSAERLCPDGPVPVITETIEHMRPGGAGLAAAMAARDGHDVVLITPVGAGPAGQSLRDCLETELIALPQNGDTVSKRRIRAGGQTIARLDAGGSSAAWAEIPDAIRQALHTADAVLVADYGYGLTRDPLFRDLLTSVAARRPVVWDPHPRGADPVPGTLLYTPNHHELAARTAELGGSNPSGPLIKRAAVQAKRLAGELSARAVVATLSEYGAVLSFGDDSPIVISADAATGDTCGAGDRFATAATAAIAEGALLSAAVEYAVRAATDHVAQGGAAGFMANEPTPAPWAAGPAEIATEVRERGGTVVATGGCFDLLHAGHVAMLESAAKLGDCLIVCLNSDTSVSRLKGPGRPLMTQADRVRVLESLACVDAVEIFDENTPLTALDRIRPDIWVKGGDYAGQQLPEHELLKSWDGQVLTLPYLAGRSTSALVKAMARPA